MIALFLIGFLASAAVIAGVAIAAGRFCALQDRNDLTPRH